MYISADPRPPAAKKLTARSEWRVRTGDYRVIYRMIYRMIYRIEDAALAIIIVQAGHRREIYSQ